MKWHKPEMLKAVKKAYKRPNRAMPVNRLSVLATGKPRYRRKGG